MIDFAGKQLMVLPPGIEKHDGEIRVSLIRQAASKTNDAAGGGTTTTTGWVIAKFKPL